MWAEELLAEELLGWTTGLRSLIRPMRRRTGMPGQERTRPKRTWLPGCCRRISTSIVISILFRCSRVMSWRLMQMFRLWRGISVSGHRLRFVRDCGSSPYGIRIGFLRNFLLGRKIIPFI